MAFSFQKAVNKRDDTQMLVQVGWVSKRRQCHEGRRKDGGGTGEDFSNS